MSTRSVLTKALKSVVDFICFCTKFYMSAWVFGGRIEPAECKIDWITISTVQIIAITSIAVCDTDKIAVLLQPNHWVVCIWTHVLHHHSTHNSPVSIQLTTCLYQVLISNQLNLFSHFGTTHQRIWQNSKVSNVCQFQGRVKVTRIFIF